MLPWGGDPLFLGVKGVGSVSEGPLCDRGVKGSWDGRVPAKGAPHDLEPWRPSCFQPGWLGEWGLRGRPQWWISCRTLSCLFQN